MANKGKYCKMHGKAINYTKIHVCVYVCMCVNKNKYVCGIGRVK